MQNLELVLALSAAINRFVQYVKPFVGTIGLEQQWRVLLLQIIQGVTGVALAASANLNIITGFPVPEWFGVVITGLLAAVGSEAIHAAVELLYSWREKPAQPPVTEPAAG
jgi:hypothetical protein